MKIFQTTLKMSELTGYPFLGYGHLDTFLGRNSHVDIYPKLLEWLEKYADSRNTAGASARSTVSDHGSDELNMNHRKATSSYSIVCFFSHAIIRSIVRSIVRFIDTFVAHS